MLPIAPQLLKGREMRPWTVSSETLILGAQAVFTNMRTICCIIISLLILMSGCTGKYFRDTAQPSSPSRYTDVSDLTHTEYWTGIVFNGKKIGYSHLAISASQETANNFDIHSEAALRFRFLMFDKHINMKSYDRVAPDLSLKQFSYEYDFDGSKLKLIGQLLDDALEVEIITRGNVSSRRYQVEEKIYPLSVINLYPVVQGLEIGRTFAYRVFDGETQTIATVNQEIVAYEESDLFEGAAYKMKTRLHGQNVTTWIDASGRPVLEMSLGGVIISALENEKTAVRYLTQAALNKEDVLLDFSLIKSNKPIPDPDQISFLKVALSGFDDTFEIPVDDRQDCEPLGEELICRIDSSAPTGTGNTDISMSPTVRRYLLPSYIVASNNQRIRETASDIVKDTQDVMRQIELLLEWIRIHIEQVPVDVVTAMDVLEGRQAECQGHTYLYAAFARALDIPTRVANGIVYAEEFQGFLYHTWAESLVNGNWVAVDPTFYQIPADATHIKLLEGEHPSELLPLVSLIGKLKLRVITAESAL